MDREQWLEWRRNKIGASDAPIILMESPWVTPYQLWDQKVNGTQQDENSAMRRGTELEPIALRKFEEKMNVFLKAQDCVINPSRPWQIATLDGFDGKTLVEIKCTNRANHRLAEQGKIPDHYIAQLQHQLDVTGLQSMYYFSFDGEDGVIVEVQRDQKYIDKMVVKEEKFWRCIMEKEAPPLTDKDYTQIESDIWRKKSEEWKEVDRLLKELGEKEENLRNELIALANDRNAVGNGVKLTVSVTRGAVDYTQIPQLKGINIETYRKNSITKRRLSAIS